MLVSYLWVVAITMLLLVTEIRKRRRQMGRNTEMNATGITVCVVLSMVFPLGLWVAYELHKRRTA